MDYSEEDGLISQTERKARGNAPAWWPPAAAYQTVSGSGYKGWTPTGEAIARVPANIPPREFFDRFVGRRRPCVVTGLLTDPEFRAYDLWTDTYLSAAGGEDSVRVEVREDSAAAFGRGRKVRMPFGEFLRRAGSGDDSVYLSAQPLPENTDGPSELYAPPLRGRLAADVPLRPRLLGRLVPQQLNVWMGSAKRPSSSGLHHDFHDNLYVLLRGKKHFTLYPPSCARALRTSGRVQRVCPNGLISYEGMETRADGLSLELEAEAARRGGVIVIGAAGKASVKDAARFSKPQGGLGAGAAAQLEAAELALEAARGERAPAHELRALARVLAAAEEAVDVSMDSALDGGGDFGFGLGSGNISGEDGGSEEGEGEDARLPDNFVSEPAPAWLRPLEANLRAGEMLFLPASWFHEVRSCNLDRQAGAREPASGIGHFALNYWCHPPDTSNFDQPYASMHWKTRFDKLFGSTVRASPRAGRGAVRKPRRLEETAHRALHPLRRMLLYGRRRAPSASRRS